MGYTNDELWKMTYKELCQIKPEDMLEHPPIMGLGFPGVVEYHCKYCGEPLEGSERTTRKYIEESPFFYDEKPKRRENKLSKDVKCPYCGGILWEANGKNLIRRSAFPRGHFDIERRRYLKYLKEHTKYVERINAEN